MKLFLILVWCITLSSCTPYNRGLKYGPPLKDHYQYYPPVSPIDLKGNHYKIVVIDKRDTDRISCADFSVPRDTEFEGQRGKDFFINYFHKMIEANKGVLDPEGENIIVIELKALSAKVNGFFYIRIRAIVDFDVLIKGVRKTYCSCLTDGDKYAPVGKFTFTTRRSAFSRMVSASTRRAIEEFIYDLSKQSK